MAARARGLSPPPTGDRPLSPVGGGATGPLFLSFSRDLVANLKKKNYTLGLSPYGGRPGGIFEILQKRTYIFEIFIFFKYKKEKSAPDDGP